MPLVKTTLAPFSNVSTKSFAFFAFCEDVYKRQLPIVSTIAEKQNNKVALTYFMPPVVPTIEFPLGDFDFLNFSWYNKLTYKIAQGFFWKFIKQDTNEYRKELGLPILKENLVTYLDKQRILDLYCISQSLIPQPKDWESHHKITGFINIPKQRRERHFLDKTDVYKRQV